MMVKNNYFAVTSYFMQGVARQFPPAYLRKLKNRFFLLMTVELNIKHIVSFRKNGSA